MIKIIDKINLEEVLNSYYLIENQIQWDNAFPKGKQCGLQYKVDEDPWIGSTGRSKGKELEYDLLNPCFKDTIFESVIQKYNLKRTRLLWLNNNACYTFHKDATPRIHIPIITNEQCFFIFKSGIIQHLELGNVYWVDTTQEHNAINGSREMNRLHLVGVVNK